MIRDGQLSGSFGGLLRQFRMAAGFSQEHLAERAHISVEAVSALERGARRAPHRETITLLAKGLALSDRQHAELEEVANRARGRARPDQSTGTERPAQNLPARLTSFVGREAEIATLSELLEKYRLVTITGSGGVGKTRLVLEAASRLRERGRAEIWFVDLAPLRDGTFIAGKIASTLGVALDTDSGPELAKALRSRKMTLILDNCEHLIDEAATIAAAVLQTCPLITILATSRERLGITGEARYRLPSLSIPSGAPASVDEACSFGALALFVERAQAAEPGFVLTKKRIQLVAEICRRLDGIPLAIELAAARLPALGLGTLHERLHEGFVLAGGARDLPLRQQTMLATIDWSYQLLDKHERTLLPRLGVFAGSLRLDAAERVCADDVLPESEVARALLSLVERSLVNILPEGDDIRYTLLEAVRTFGLGLAEQPSAAEFYRRHAEWMAWVADRAEASAHNTQTAWLAEHSVEFDNARSAVEWALESPSADDALIGAKILCGLHALWLWTRQTGECQRRAEAALARIDETRYPIVAARLLHLIMQCSSGEARISAGERALVLYDQIGDHTKLFRFNIDLMYEYWRMQRLKDAEFAAARAVSAAIEANLQDTSNYAMFLLTRSLLRTSQQRFDEGRADVKEAEDIATRLGDQVFVVMWCWSYRAGLELNAGNPQVTVQIAQEMLAKELDPPADALVAATALIFLAQGQLLLGNTISASHAAKDLLRRGPGVYTEQRIDAITVQAAVSAHGHSPLVAATLLGFVDAGSDREDYRRTAVDQRIYDMLESSLRERLSSEALERARAAGAQYTLERAVDEALLIT